MRRERPCSPFHADPEPAQFRQAIRFDGATKQALETGRTRLLFASLLFAVAFLVVAGRLVSVALLSSSGEPSIAETPRATQLETERADIVDRNGIVLATNLVTASLYANPREVPNPRAAAAALSKVLPELKQDEVELKLASEKSFVWLKRNLTPKQQYAVNRLGIPGLSFQREERRVYPHGNLAAHILGFTDIDNRGIAGVEKQFEARLAEEHAPLALSMDIRLQHILKEELSKSVEDFSAIGGAGVILDARTGEVLAMVSLPDFDPNEPGRASADTRFNRATLGVYEMGSVFKVFTTSMALDEGVTSLKGGYDASHPIKVARYTITDYHAKNRWLSVPEIFIYSSNIGSAKMALDVGPEGQRAFLKKLGMLSPVALELPELGDPQGPVQWKELAAMTIAFGHGLSVTPMHVAGGVATVVNGGLKVQPTLVKREEPVEGVRLIKPETSDAMRGLMRLVVERGTGKNADAPGYRVGGKTGTAEKAAAQGYKHSALISSFVGAFPMDAPRYVIFMAIDEPKPNKESHGYATGGWVAAPAVKRLVERMAPLVGIAPIEEEDGAPDAASSLFVAVKAGD
jgi:cell division protein FtsI (penicillin-binding protein 3)